MEPPPDTTAVIASSQPQVGGSESGVAGVSIRAWLALLLTGAVCAMALLGREVKEPLYTLSIVAIGFYFGQKVKR